MLMPIPAEVRALLEAPNFVHLTTLRADGTPRNWVVWVNLVDDLVLVCTGIDTWKPKDMVRDPRVSLSVVDQANPYRMAALQGRVAEVRDDTDGIWMDAISMKYTGKPFPLRGEGRVRFAIAIDKAGHRTLGFTHDPGN